KQQGFWPISVFRCRRPTNVQFMVKDSKKYATTGGWGFGHFKDGKPADEAFMKHASPATIRSKLATLCSPVMHLDIQNHSRSKFRNDESSLLDCAAVLICGIAIASAIGDEGPSPGFEGAVGWLNSVPLSGKGAARKGLLVNFWTYSRVNSLHSRLCSRRFACRTVVADAKKTAAWLAFHSSGPGAGIQRVHSNHWGNGAR